MPYVLRQVKRVLELSQDVVLTLRKDGRSTVIDVPGRGTIKIASGGAHGFKIADLDGEKLGSFAGTYVYGPATLDGVYYDEKQSKASIRDEDLLLWLPRIDGVPYIMRDQTPWFSVKALADLIDDSLSTKTNNKFFIQNLSRHRDTTYANLEGAFKADLTDLYGVKQKLLSGDCMALVFVTLEGLKYILDSNQRAPETEIAIARLRQWFNGVHGFPLPPVVVNPIMAECVDRILILQESIADEPQEDRESGVEEVVVSMEPDTSEPKELSLAEFFPGAGDAKIRISPTGLISIYDVMRFFGYANPWDPFARLKEAYPETLGQTEGFRFGGRGPTSTPVAALETIIELVNVMQGPKVAKYRAQFAKVITRYIRGDMSLIDEVIENHERIRQLPEEAPARAILNVHAEVKQFCDENNLKFLNLQKHNGIPGIYCIIIGLYKGVLIFKVGCAHDIKKRLEQHLAEYPRIKNEDFQVHVCPIYAGQTSSYRVAELSLKRILRSLGVRLKNVALDGRKEDTELFTLSNGMTIEHVLDILRSQSEDDQALVVETSQLDHEYRMRQLDVSLEMRKVDVGVELEREKTKQMELQLEILKLSGSLPQMLALAKAIPN
jgi:hypothetical protein